jgi:hypothetical protein
MTDDVKELLGKAFGPEPPLRLDRDEVLRQGRKRLRRRRFFEAGGVVTAVVVAALGAATLTNLVGSENDPERLPPAASRTMQAPPGPDLPLPMSPAPTSAPVSTTVTTMYPPLLQGHAMELTLVLAKSDTLAQADVRPRPDVPDVPRFRVRGDEYVYEADVYRPDKQGFLEVTVGRATTSTASCALFPASYGACDIRSRGGLKVALASWRSGDGEERSLALTVLDDGSQVAALASNRTYADLETGVTPPPTGPVLDDEEMCDLVAKSGLHVG